MKLMTNMKMSVLGRELFLPTITLQPANYHEKVLHFWFFFFFFFLAYMKQTFICQHIFNLTFLCIFFQRNTCVPQKNNKENSLCSSHYSVMATSQSEHLCWLSCKSVGRLVGCYIIIRDVICRIWFKLWTICCCIDLFIDSGLEFSIYSFKFRILLRHSKINDQNWNYFWFIWPFHFFFPQFFELTDNCYFITTMYKHFLI